MNITKIKKGKKRYNVYIDEEFSLAVGEETLLKLDLYEGKKIDQEELERINHYEDSVRAKDYALNLLSYRPRSKRELTRRLKEKKFGEETAQEILINLEQIGLVDDYDFAKYYIESYRDKKGIYRLKNELIKLGIDMTVIDKALEEVPVDEKQTATKLIDKWLRTHKVRDKGTEKRLVDHLVRRGISWDTVSDLRKHIKQRLMG